MLESIDTSTLRAAFDAIEGTVSTGNAVYQVMSDAIVAGDIPDSARLTELDVAKVFAVSRTPIREALARLEGDGLATRDRYGRLIVAGLSRQQILDIYAVREVLDGLAARLACEYRSELDLADLRRLNDGIAEAAERGDHRRMASLNVEFHELVASASQNEFLQRFGREVHRTVRRFRSTTFQHPGRAALVKGEHAAIIDAIERRNGDDADRLARLHMRNAAAVRVAMFADGTSTGGIDPTR
jgi:DNA-binding GntR family transcriptional regulator